MYVIYGSLFDASKSEFIWFGSWSLLSKIPTDYCSITPFTTVDIAVQCSKVVRELGVYVDSEPQMEHHVNKVASICYYHLPVCCLFQLCRSMSQSVNYTTCYVADFVTHRPVQFCSNQSTSLNDSSPAAY